MGSTEKAAVRGLKRAGAVKKRPRRVAVEDHEGSTCWEHHRSLFNAAARAMIRECALQNRQACLTFVAS
jgi:hypothetical protein